MFNTYFHLRVFKDSTLSDYISAMENNRHSIHHDLGVSDVFDEPKYKRQARNECIERLITDPGIRIGEYHTSYMDQTLQDRRNRVPEVIDRLWGYVGERRPILDSYSISDLKSIFIDAVKVDENGANVDTRIVATQDEFFEFLNDHHGGRLFCFFL